MHYLRNSWTFNQLDVSEKQIRLERSAHLQMWTRCPLILIALFCVSKMTLPVCNMKVIKYKYCIESMSAVGSRKRSRRKESRRIFQLYKLHNNKLHEPVGEITVNGKDTVDSLKQKIQEKSGATSRFFAIRNEDLFDLILKEHYTADELIVLPLKTYVPSQATTGQFYALAEAIDLPVKPNDMMIPLDVSNLVVSKFRACPWFQMIRSLRRNAEVIQEEKPDEFNEKVLVKLYARQLKDVASDLDIRTKPEWKIEQIDEDIIEAGFDRVSGRVDIAFLGTNSTGIDGVLGLVEVKATLPTLTVQGSLLTKDECQLLSILLMAQKRSAHRVIGALTNLYQRWIFYWWKKDPVSQEIKFVRTKAMHPEYALPFLR